MAEAAGRLRKVWRSGRLLLGSSQAIAIWSTLSDFTGLPGPRSLFAKVDEPMAWQCSDCTLYNAPWRWRCRCGGSPPPEPAD